MRLSSWRGQLLFVVLLLVLGGARSEAAEPDKSEDLIRQGLELRRTGNDQKAYYLFRKANEVSHSPRSSGQLGFCEQALGRWADAETHLADSLLSSNDPWIKKNRPSIEQALMAIKTHIARVEVVGDPPGATVSINGGVVGQLPLGDLVRVPAGEIEVQVRASGFARGTRTLHVEGGQYYKVALSLERETPSSTPAASASGSRTGPAVPVAVPAASALAPGAASDPIEAETGDRNPDAASASSPSAFRGSLKFVSWGIAAAALGVGVYGYMHNSTLVQEFDSGCGDDHGVARVTPTAPAGFTDLRCANLKNSYQSATTLSVVGFAGAAVFIGVGVALWLTEPARDEGRVALWSCAPFIAQRGSPSMACAVNF